MVVILFSVDTLPSDQDHENALEPMDEGQTGTDDVGGRYVDAARDPKDAPNQAADPSVHSAFSTTPTDSV